MLLHELLQQKELPSACAKSGDLIVPVYSSESSWKCQLHV